VTFCDKDFCPRIEISCKINLTVSNLSHFIVQTTQGIEYRQLVFFKLPSLLTSGGYVEYYYKVLSGLHFGVLAYCKNCGSRHLRLFRGVLGDNSCRKSANISRGPYSLTVGQGSMLICLNSMARVSQRRKLCYFWFFTCKR
jgi:hypothetical protein